MLRSRRRVALGAGAVTLVVAAAVVALVLALGGTRAGPAIATGAARLVPADALAYVHVSTDGDRSAVRRAERLAEGFPSWPRLRDGLARRLGASGARPWLGDEAAVALTPAGGGAAATLVLLSVRDRDAARRFVGTGGEAYRGVRIGHGGAALVGGYVALGPPLAVHRAIDLQQGRGRSLASEPAFTRATEGLPADRVADAYVTATGLRLLLAPSGGIAGVLGTLLDRPGLEAVGLAVRTVDPGLRIALHSVGARAGAAFEPSLATVVPRGAMALLDTQGLDAAAARLLRAAGPRARPLLRAARRLLHGETAVALLPGVPAPTLLLIARTDDPAGAGAVLARTGVDGAVLGDRVVLASAPAGVAAARDPRGGLAATAAWRAVAGDPDRPVSSVLFLDFSQLLGLGERTGLGGSRMYRAVKADLERLRAIGAVSSGTGEDTTAEVSLLIR